MPVPAGSLAHPWSSYCIAVPIRSTPVTTRIILAAIVIAFAGCGNDQLTDDEALTVATARIAAVQTVFDDSMAPAASEGVNRVIKIYRAKPDAEYRNQDGTLTMRQVMEDMASDLEKSQPSLASKLDRALNR